MARLSIASMDIKQIRLANLLSLIEEFGGAKHGQIKRFADKIGADPTYISLIKNGHRSMGDQLARQYEKACGKPHGWMDQMHEDQPELPGDSPFNANPRKYNDLSQKGKEAADTVMGMTESEIAEILPLLRRYQKKKG